MAKDVREVETRAAYALAGLFAGYALRPRRGRSHSSTAEDARTPFLRRAGTRTGASARATASRGTGSGSAGGAGHGSDQTNGLETVRLDALSAAQVHRIAGALELLEGSTRVLLDEGEGLMHGGLEELGGPMLQIVSDVGALAERIRAIGEQRG